MHRLAFNQHLAGKVGVHARDDFHHGRFAGAIFADKAVDFTRKQGEIDVAQRPDAAKGLGNIAHFYQRGNRGRRWKRGGRFCVLPRLCLCLLHRGA